MKVVISVSIVEHNPVCSCGACVQLDSNDGAEALDSISPLLSPLCVSWGLPAPTATNRKWLHTQLLRHAVISHYLQNMIPCGIVCYSIVILTSIRIYSGVVCIIPTAALQSVVFLVETWLCSTSQNCVQFLLEGQ